MKIGLQLPNFTWPDGPKNIASTLANIARAADEAGFASLWVMDHFFQIGDPNRSMGLGPAEDEMLESYSTLSYLAALTQNIKLGTMVTGVIYRHPGILAKTVTTLDVLSGGRAYLGIGAAWFEREAKGLGIPYPELSERFERLEETLQIVKQMWSGDNGPYRGKHYELAETINSPQVLSKPHPPILIGGGGEKKTLRLVAQYADACNLFTFGGADAVKSKLDVLKQHCDKLGRNYDEIEKTGLGVAFIQGPTSAANIIEQCHQLAKVGVQQIIYSIPTVHEITPLEIFGRDIIPAVAEL
jgi:F420-dependent oxidoreductase-like protein